MADFGPLGGVKVTGFISPTDTLDTYAVIDPWYGIDGFRNYSGGTSNLNAIPDLRRRAGMIVGINDGSNYYKLNPAGTGWTNTISDWTEVNFGGITGATDTYVTGFTWNSSTYDLTIKQNNGEADKLVNLAVLASDIYVLSGVYDPATGVVTYTNSSGGTFTVSGFTTGMTDSYTTSAYLSGNTIQFNNNIQGNNLYSVDLTPLLSGSTSPYEYNNTEPTAIQPVLGTNSATGLNSNIGGGSGNTASDKYATVGGGLNNTSSSWYSTIAGGEDNTSSGFHSFVGGGYNNTSSGTNSTIGGGSGNTNSGSRSTIAGGQSNTTISNHSFIGGGLSNSESFGNFSSIVGGSGNYINTSQLSFIGGGQNNEISGATGKDKNVIGGGYENIINGVTKSSIVGGSNNTINTNGTYDSGSFIGGGTSNKIIGNSEYGGNVIVGGGSGYYNVGNMISGNTASIIVGGGWSGPNIITGENEYSNIIIGGNSNIIRNASDSFIGGGSVNIITGSTSFIGSGFQNMAGDSLNFIGNGTNNRVNSRGAAIITGNRNIANGDYSFIGNGVDNTINTFSDYSTIIGGNNNTILGFGHSHVHIIGSNITSVSANTTHVENLNIFRTPINDDSLTQILVRDTDGIVKYRDASSLIGSGNTSTEYVVYFSATTDNQTLFSGVLSPTPTDITKTKFFINGVKQRYGTTYDYIITGGTSVVWVGANYNIEISDELNMIYT